MSITVREINSVCDLVGIGHTWRELLEQTPGATFFQSFEWLTTYLAHFGSDQRLRILVVSDLTQPIGILPLVVRSQRHRLGRARILTYPLDGWGSFFGPIGRETSTVLAAAARHLRASQRDWDWIELPWVDPQSCQSLEIALTGVGYPLTVDRCQPTALVELARWSDWNAYWQSRSGHWRNNVRRSEKKLRERGDVTYLRFRPGGLALGQSDPHWDWYSDCERIAKASWQGTSQTGTTLTHEKVRPFLRDCHRVATEAGALDLNLLRIDGRSVAFNYAYHFRGHVFGLRTGYDASLASEGAGTVLQARMIADSFARGDHTYDLGPGYLECKRYWMSTVRWSYRLAHFPVGVTPQLVRLSRGIKRLLSARGAPRGGKS